MAEEIPLKDYERLSEELMSLSRAETIASKYCSEGSLYYGVGRRISDVAICRGRNEYGLMEFEGIREKFGRDFLFREFHYDDSPSVGTWSPILQLELAPETDDESIIMNWLLDKWIDLQQTKLDWLQQMPERLKVAPYYPIDLGQALVSLESLLELRRLGFSHSPMPSFRQLLDAKKAENIASNCSQFDIQ